MSENQLPFGKYHVYGDDYIVIDNRRRTVTDFTEIAKTICRRHVSVGANAVIVLGPSRDNTFSLDLWNSNGEQGTLSGNGTGCALAYAHRLCLLGPTSKTFDAYDGVHVGKYNESRNKFGMSIHDIQFQDIQKFNDNDFHVDVGCIAHVRFVDSFDGLDLEHTSTHFWNGKYKNLYGACISFCLVMRDGDILVRTFKVGFGECAASGIGAVAVALVHTSRQVRQPQYRDLIGRKLSRDIKMKAGPLTVSFEVSKTAFTSVELVGPAVHAFNGVYFF